MMYLWKPDMIRFMRDASEYGNHNSVLAEMMLPYLSENSHVCDAGCGLGYLSLELAKKVKKVTAVDMNSDALGILSRNCAERRIENIDVVCADIFKYRPQEKFSAMVFCFFGDVDTIIEHVDSLCTGPVVLFKRNYEIHRFSDGNTELEMDSHDAACRRLREMGVSFSTVEFETEFGQPFRSFEDAELYYELYSSGTTKNNNGGGRKLTDMLEETGRKDFPYYLPYRKKNGCIIMNHNQYLKK